MSVVRGTALSNYPRLVHELGGDPVELLRDAGVRPEDVGKYDVFIALRRASAAIESAAIATATPDFGRRLALRQGIEILVPVGVAARTAATRPEALSIFEKFLDAYTPAISAAFKPLDNTEPSFFQLSLVAEGLLHIPQSIELTLGFSLRVLRLLIGADYAPVNVRIPHAALT